MTTKSRETTFSIAVIMLIASGCAKTDQGTSDTKGLAAGKIWEAPELKVCWNRALFRTNVNNVEDYVTAIEEGLNKNYSADTTKVHFVGYDDCANTPDADFQLILQDEIMPSAGGLMFGVASQLGQLKLPGTEEAFADTDKPAVKISPSAHKQVEYLTEQQGIDAVQYTLGTALHEVGHMVGLFHEHAHPRSTCRETPETAGTKFQELGFEGKDAYLDMGTPYDPNSIMSYCMLHSFMGRNEDPNVSNPKIALSDKDVNFLASMYSENGRDLLAQAANQSANTANQGGLNGDRGILAYGQQGRGYGPAQGPAGQGQGGGYYGQPAGGQPGYYDPYGQGGGYGYGFPVGYGPFSGYGGY